MLREQRYEIYYETSLKEMKEKRDNKNIEKNLKRYDYDPKTKTIKGNNGKRVPFKIQEGEGVNGSSFTKNYGKKLLGISVTKDTLKNKKDTDNTIQHELGHQNEWKNIRKEKRIVEVGDVEMRVFEKLQNKIENEEKKKNPDINALKKYVKQIKLYEEKLEKKVGKDNQKFLNDFRTLQSSCISLIEKSKYKRLNGHDLDTSEVYADLYARKHTGRPAMRKKETVNDFMINLENRLKKSRGVSECDEIKRLLKKALDDGKIEKNVYNKRIKIVDNKIKELKEVKKSSFKPLSTHERNRINKRGKDLTKLIHESKEEFFDIIDELSVMYESGEIDSAEYEIIRDLAFQAYL